MATKLWHRHPIQHRWVTRDSVWVSNRNWRRNYAHSIREYKGGGARLKSRTKLWRNLLIYSVLSLSLIIPDVQSFSIFQYIIHEQLCTHMTIINRFLKHNVFLNSRIDFFQWEINGLIVEWEKSLRGHNHIIKSTFKWMSFIEIQLNNIL
jgi:hypothetical protein